MCTTVVRNSKKKNENVYKVLVSLVVHKMKNNSKCVQAYSCSMVSISVGYGMERHHFQFLCSQMKDDEDLSTGLHSGWNSPISHEFVCSISSQVQICPISK